MKRDSIPGASLAYRKDLAGAARRHLAAAQKLYAIVVPAARIGGRAVAGYLFGLAGELAVKEMMRASGMCPLSADERRDDPFYAHFPELKTRLKDTAIGRRSDQLRKFAEDASLFQYWDADMRYAPTADIKDSWVSAWKASAEKLLDVMDLS
jgi:hypothetical protein